MEGLACYASVHYELWKLSEDDCGVAAFCPENILDREMRRFGSRVRITTLSNKTEMHSHMAVKPRVYA